MCIKKINSRKKTCYDDDSKSERSKARCLQVERSKENTRGRHFKKSVIRVCWCALKTKMGFNKKNNIMTINGNEIWDLYAKVKGNTNGIKQLDSSTSREQAFQTEFYSCVLMCIKKNEFKKKHMMTMNEHEIWDLYAKVKGNTSGIKQLNSLTRRAQAFQKEFYSCVLMCIKKKQMDFNKNHILWRWIQVRFEIYTPT